MKSINETFTDDEFERLKEEKGDQKWRTAILEAFGVAADE